jgi:hypothetical protein
MAYDRLAGMTPEIWVGQLLDRMNDATVFRSVVNTDYQGQITNFGDTVKISEIGPVSINTYSATSTSGLTVQALSEAQQILKIDQAKSFSFWVDDIDVAQINTDAMNQAMNEASWGFANNVDEYIAALHSQAGIVVGGTSATGIDITSTNVIKYLSIAQQKLDEMNVPEAGRWMVVPPWFAHKLVLARIIQDTNNSANLSRGFLGSDIYGFTVYKSNNVVNGTPAGNGARILCGYRGSISYANQILKVETVRPSFHFKTLVKGLMVYGAKVVRPNALGVLYADYTAEAT